MKRKIPAWDAIALLFFYIVVYFLSSTLQPKLTYNEGKGWDGTEYYEVAADLKHDEAPSAFAPFVYRVGTPYLAQLVSDDIDKGFKIVNHAAAFVFCLLFYLFLYLKKASPQFRFITLLLYMLSWLGIVRYLHYAYIDTDPMALVLIMAGLIIVELYIERKKLYLIYLLALLSFIGVFFREIVIIPAIIVLFAGNNIDVFFKPFRFKYRIPSRQLFLPLAAGIIGLIILQVWCEPQNNYSFFGNFFKWLYQKQATKYVHAWFIAYGLLLAVLFIDWRNAKEFLKRNHHLTAFLVIIAILAWTGGTDTERFAFWAAPVMLPLIVMSIFNNKQIVKKPVIAIILALGHIYTYRLFWIIPDYPGELRSKFPVLTPPSNDFPYLDLWTMHGDTTVLFISFAEYIVLTFLLLYLMKKEKTKLKSVILS